MSFLPLTDHGYKQAPYEEINQRTYAKAAKGIKKPRLNEPLDEEDKIMERFCDSEICEISFEPTDGI